MGEDRVSNLIERIKKFSSLIKSEDLNFLSYYEARAQELLKKMTECQVIIPLVGEFSSGKSSLVNSLIGQRVLPIDITPTTFLVNEIIFSEDRDRIEIERYDGSIEHYDKLIDLNEIHYYNAKLVRVYVSKRVLPRNIVLVDLPGLASVIERHDEIIVNYLPKADVIFVVVDINQGTLTHLLVKFLEMTKSLEKKLYLILTKADTKLASEIPSIKEYYQKNFPFIEDIIITSAKENKFEELLKVIEKINMRSIDLTYQSVSMRFTELCKQTTADLKEHIKNSKLDLRELESQIRDLESGMEVVKRELQVKLRNLESGLNEIKEKTVSEFSKLIGNQLNKLVDSYFDSKETFQRDLENAISTALERSTRLFEREFKIKFLEFQNELESLRQIKLDIHVSSSIRNIIDSAREVILVTIINLFLPGGVLHAFLAKIILDVISKIPRVGKYANLIMAPINELIAQIGKLIARPSVKSKLEETFSKLVLNFKEEIKNQIDLIYRETKVTMENEFNKVVNNYRDNIQKLIIEKQSREKEFAEYVNRVENLLSEIEKICLLRT